VIDIKFPAETIDGAHRILLCNTPPELQKQIADSLRATFKNQHFLSGWQDLARLELLSFSNCTVGAGPGAKFGQAKSSVLALFQDCPVLSLKLRSTGFSERQVRFPERVTFDFLDFTARCKRLCSSLPQR
jgi:hypothetical protein